MRVIIEMNVFYYFRCIFLYRGRCAGKLNLKEGTCCISVLENIKHVIFNYGLEVKSFFVKLFVSLFSYLKKIT